MTAVTLPSAGLKAGFVENETGWNDELNRNLRAIDALLQLSVASMVTAAPPSITSSGMRYIVPTGASGQWIGQENKIAVSEMGDDIVTPTWFFLAPAEGWEAWNQATGTRYRYNGTAWAPVPSGGGGGSSAWADLTGVPDPIADLAALVDPEADRLLFWDDSAGVYKHLELGANLSITGSTLNAEAGSGGAAVQCFAIACSDETTALAAGASKVTFRMPFAMTGVTVRASLTTAQASGSPFTVDVNEGGNSILSTKLTIDNGEKSSVTAAAPAVVSDGSVADDAEITVDIDQVGDGTAKGLKVYIIGTPA